MLPLRFALLLTAIFGVVQGAPVLSENEAWSSDLIARQQTTVVGRLDLLPAFQTCSPQRFNIIRSALINVHLLTDAVQGVSGADPSLQSFFGVGWVGRKYPTYFAMIADNLLKAGAVTRQSGPFLAKVSCEDVENRCSKIPSPIAYNTGQTDDAGRHTIVACPKFFQNIGVTKHAQSLADVQKLKPTTDLQRVDTYEHYLLHEILHLTNAGYKTAVSPPGIGDNHIGDLKFTFSLESFERTINGANLCKRYAQAKSPPIAALSNADSYAWYATSKFVTKTWGVNAFRKSRRAISTVQGIAPPPGPDDAVVPTGDDNDNYSFAGDPGQAFTEPDETCAAANQPSRTECEGIDIDPADFSFIDFANAGSCFTNGNRKWCDLYTFASCQVSIGWDTTENSGKVPSVKTADLASMVDAQLNTTDECSPFTQDTSGACVQGGPAHGLCNTGFRFCIKTVGQDCRP